MIHNFILFILTNQKESSKKVIDADVTFSNICKPNECTVTAAASASTEHVEAAPEPVNHLTDEPTASSNTEIKSSNMTETKLM